MKAKDLRARSTEDLRELEASLKKDLFSQRMKNFTNQLDDTSLLRKARRDIARVEGIINQRNGEAKASAESGGKAS